MGVKLTLISRHSKFIFMFYNIFTKNNGGAPWGTPPSLSYFDLQIVTNHYSLITIH